MKKYKIQNRSQKNSHSCVPLSMLLLCRLVHLQQPFQNSTGGVEFSADATMAYNMLICTDADRPTHYNVAKTILLLHFYPKASMWIRISMDPQK